MTEDLTELRNKCSERNAKFLELWVDGKNKFNAYRNAGFKAKNNKVASAGICRLLKKVNNSAYLAALKSNRDTELQRRTNITRTMQLNALDDAMKLAEKLGKPAAMVAQQVAAIRHPIHAAILMEESRNGYWVQHPAITMEVPTVTMTTALTQAMC